MSSNVEKIVIERKKVVVDFVFYKVEEEKVI